MIQLIYFSAASYLYSNVELIEMFNRSRKNNADLNITGLMIYHEGSIIQILEGQAHDVHDLYNKISRDRRHKSILKVIDANIEERSFKDWSMGIKPIIIQDWKNVAGYINLDHKEAFKEIKNLKNKHIVKMISSFGKVNRLNNLNFCLQ